MSIQEDLKNCKNIFDVAAVLYSDCENGAGDRRFTRVSAILEDSTLLDGKIRDFRRRMISALQPIIESAGTDGLLSSSEHLNGKAISWYFSDLVRLIGRTKDANHLASWSVLKVIDHCIAPRVPDLVRMNRDSHTPPLNANHNQNVPKVYVKLPTPLFVPVEWIPENPEDDAYVNLENLAFTFSPMTQIAIYTDGILWDLLRKAPLVLAVLVPEVKESFFKLQSPPPQSNASRVFWVSPEEPQQYRDEVLDLILRADAAGASIALLPELCSSKLLEDQLHERLSREPLRNIRLVAMGSYHEGQPDARMTNVCSVLDRTGALLWQQTKRSPYRIKMLPLIGPKELRKLSGYREWIKEDGSQVMALTPIGAVAVQICLDFLKEEDRSQLCRLGCRWFLIPAFTGKLNGKFRRHIQNCGDLSQAVGAIANNRCWCAWGLSSQSHDDYLFYKPDKREPFPPGEELHRGLRLLRLERKNTENFV